MKTKIGNQALKGNFTMQNKEKTSNNYIYCSIFKEIPSRVGQQFHAKFQLVISQKHLSKLFTLKIAQQMFVPYLLDVLKPFIFTISITLDTSRIAKMLSLRYLWI